ncbi:MAG: cyclic nucleotide-binding domain-containing protein [Pirellulales bacterium]|nr:cyclic nucleotide-binding domain-containing protein [Pirellulales bacterium]
MHRCEPGEIVVREGDYGNSAFLVLAGSVSVMVSALTPEQLGRQKTKQYTWSEALRRFLKPSSVAEARLPREVTTNVNDVESSGTIRNVDDRPALFLQDFEGVLRDNETVSLGPGELFGEVAAMYRSPRTATVIAETEATLLEIRWQGLRVLRRDRGFAASLDEHYRTHWLPVHLREAPLLRHLPEASLARVAEATQLHSFGRMEWNADYRKQRRLPVEQQIESEPVVATEGRMPTELILVRSGFGRLSQHFGASHRTTAYLGKGQVYGLEELAYNALRPVDSPARSLQQSLRAVGFLDTLSIPAEIFAQEILPHVRRSELPEAVAKLLLEPKHRRGEKVERRREERKTSTPKSAWQDLPSSTGHRFQPTGLLEFIVQHRLNNGRQAMVIDLHRCTRCDDCVKACASAHDGNPRFVRQGVAQERLQFVQACMQCADPVCMIGCPTGAIARNEETGVVEVHEPICVGCGTCAASCPYQNIQMVQVHDHQGRPYTDMNSGRAIEKATKCDMCSRQPSGPACAAACPHDALVRIDLSSSKPLQEWLDRRS